MNVIQKIKMKLLDVAHFVPFSFLFPQLPILTTVTT